MTASRTPLSDRCNGRWEALLPAIGIGTSFLTGKHTPCPMCGGKDRWRFINRNGSGDWHCNQCGHGTGIDLAMQFLKLDFRGVAQRLEEFIGDAPVKVKPPRDTKAERDEMLVLWRRSVPITPTCPAGLYLASRGIEPCAALRYVDSPPQMVAKIISPDGSHAVNIHRTFLDREGRKASMEKVKFLMKGDTPAGSAIRLSPVVDEMGIAEGIESARAAEKLFRVPTWAAIHAAGVEKFMPPEGIKRLWIFGENDLSFTSHAVSYALARRLTNAKEPIEAKVKIPEDVGFDWDDVLMNAAGRRSAA
jgi:putative DNA primase/helicase